LLSPAALIKAYPPPPPPLLLSSSPPPPALSAGLSAQSVIYDQAENRLHAQKALLTLLVNGFDWKL